MENPNPRIEFFTDLPEELSNVSLRRHQQTGVRSVLLTFNTLKAIEKFQSFTKEFNGHLSFIDTEGTLNVEPSSVKFIFGGDDGDDLKGVQCGFDLLEEEHWQRFMRFMKRYAAANGMDYQEK